MNPPPGMPDPMKLSRMIRLLNDYVSEGLIQKPERPFKTMTEGELDDLIDVARVRREEKENPPEPEAAEPEEEPPVQEEAAQAVASGATPAAVPAQPEPRPEGTTNVEPNEEGQLTEQEFKDRYPIGTHIDYQGIEHVVVEHSKTGAEGGPSFTTISLGEEGTSFTKQEAEDGDFELHESPRKVPQKTEYPPQVFLVSWIEDGNALAQIYKDLGAVKDAHPDLDGDTIMEAISDPGTPQSGESVSITFSAIS